MAKSSPAMRRKPVARRSTTKAYPTMPLERDEQNAVIKWAKMMVDTGQEPRLRFLRCGFEGLRLSMGVRMQMKRQSVSRGFPDLVLYVPKTATIYPDPRKHIMYHALFIELKRLKGGTVSSEQAIMIGDLNSLGYKAVLCRGADAAIVEIKRYLGIEGLK